MVVVVKLVATYKIQEIDAFDFVQNKNEKTICQGFCLKNEKITMRTTMACHHH